MQRDAPAIRRLIWKAGINPTGLDWRRFVVIVDADDRLLACGQLKPHGSILELASLAVQLEARGQGLARQIVEHLKAQSRPPLYLMCASYLEKFYNQFGFHVVEVSEIPAGLAWMERMVNFVPRLRRRPVRLLIMRWDGV